MAGLAVALALACGGSDGTATSTAGLTIGDGSSSYAGTLDKTSVPTVTSDMRVGLSKMDLWFQKPSPPLARVMKTTPLPSLG